MPSTPRAHPNTHRETVSVASTCQTRDRTAAGRSRCGYHRECKQSAATRRAHLEASPYLSCNYWAENQDTCVAECQAEWAFDLPTRQWVWNLFESAPAPVGYDPAIIPFWEGPDSAAFAALRLTPWRLRVMPGTAMLTGAGEVLAWQT